MQVILITNFHEAKRVDLIDELQRISSQQIPIHQPQLDSIVAKCPGLAGTVPVFGPMSRLCPGLPDFAALSRNPARLHKWRCGTSISSVYYRISVRISRYLVGVAIRNRPKVGVVIRKWAWSIKFRARFARVIRCPGLSSHKLGNYVIVTVLTGTAATQRSRLST